MTLRARISARAAKQIADAAEWWAENTHDTVDVLAVWHVSRGKQPAL